MKLDDYFDFATHHFDEVGQVDTIKFKGSRIGLEHVIEPFLKGDSPERIFQGYRHSLTLEQVYAAITYYLHNKDQVDAYLKRGDEIADYYYQDYLKKEPPEVVKRLRALKAAKLAAQATER
jgi:uncharacterized protein (DUF433 family)